MTVDLSLYRHLFARVSDAYGLEMPYGPDAKREPLTDDLLRDHVDGKVRIGAYTIDREGLADQIVIDHDIPKEKVNDPKEWERVRAEAKRVLSAFDEHGIEAFITSSKSRGYHVRTLWEPSPAATLRKVGEYIVRRAGIVAEVFPKQDRRGDPDPATGLPKLGYFVWLPLHGESLKNGKTAILDDGNGLDPMPDQWEALRGIRRNSHETLASVQAVVEEQERISGPTVPAVKEVRDKIPEMYRRDTLTSIAGTLRRRGLEEKEILPTLLEVNRNRCDPPVSDKHVRDIAKGIPLRYAPSAPIVGDEAVISFNLTDAGNAQRLVAYLNGLGRYCYPFKAWYLYDGTRWAEDKTGAIFAAAKAAVKAIYAEAAACKNDDRREAVGKHAVKSETERGLKAMIALAQSEPGIPVSPSDFDQHPDLLNCLNGTVSLRSGRIKPHDPADLLTQLIPISFDEDAPRERWRQFLNEVFKGRQELIDYLQRLIGFYITGLTTEQIFAIFYGSGANGKSTLLDVLLEVFADYMTSTPFSTFAVQRNQGIRNDLADLHNVRIVATSESSEGQRLNEELIKRATGDASIKSRFLFKEFFTYKRKFKIIMSVNHLPKIRGTDHAIWRRVRCIPFDATFEGENCDLNLKEKLLAEAPGILAWAVLGSMLWHDMGLGYPDAVKAATAHYKEDEDTLGCFLKECCILDPTHTQAARPLYQSYRDYCGGKTVSEKAFSKNMGNRGYEKETKKTGVIWNGLELLPGRATPHGPKGEG